MISSQIIVCNANLSVSGSFWARFWGLFPCTATCWCSGDDLLHFECTYCTGRSEENHGPKKRSHGFEVPVTSIPAVRLSVNCQRAVLVADCLLTRRRVVSLRAASERTNGFLLPFHAVQRKRTRETTGRLATSPLTVHSAIKGVKNWAMNANVFWKRDFFENPSFRAVGILQWVRKSSPSHQRVTVHRNSPEKRHQCVTKNVQFQIRAKISDLRRNRLLGFNVSWFTEIILKNVLCGSKNSPGTVKTEL